MKKNSAKKALFVSVISMLIMVSMFVGSTFAWFTDSVSSVNNKIVSGNLDVELEYLVDGNWETVDADTNVFEENTLWEPGHTEIVYLRMSNVGSLALKYKLGVNVAYEAESVNVYDEAFKLSEYIVYGAIEDVETAFADRKAARAAVTTETALADGYNIAGELYPEGEVDEAADRFGEKYVALVVYMPEKVGNEVNYKKGATAPEIHLGINLMATQFTYEEDSYGPDYDDQPLYGGVPTAKVTKVAEMPEVTDMVNNTTVTLDTAYVFETTEDYASAQQNTHAKWHADFVATLDKSVPANAFGLGGQYDTFSSDWLAFGVDMAVTANTPVRMLELANIYMNYEELCNLVKQFQCGAFAIDELAMSEVTMTVELRLYETKDPADTANNTTNEETGAYLTIGTFSYTFPKAENSDLPDATIVDADQYENVALTWNTQWVSPSNANQQLESVYVFKSEDDYAAAQNSPYADWIADYYVTLSEDIATGDLVLAGNYGTYGWIGFENPMDVTANTAVGLLKTANMEISYEDIILMTDGEFTCGVADAHGTLDGVTITVDLRITNPNNPNEYYVITSTSYTF